MPFIKKLEMHGFKSFAKHTEILFEKGLNVVVGPNGSGKSNVTESICFVLGRLSAKSMRAAKSANLIYNGGKEHKPAHEAKVGIVFDNSDGAFSLGTKEVEITRFLKKDGTSVYKINNETKTRQEILEMLAQASIDPEGFNIILQSEIDSFIKMHPEERREIIEEIAGISIYENRKEKSLNELEKTEVRLKEIKTVLTERSAYLNNLEKEREQALKAETLQKDIAKEKASVISRHIEDKKKIVNKTNNEISERKTNIDKIKTKIENYRFEISSLNQKIREIEDKIEKQTGVEQENLRSDVVNLKTELATLRLKRDNLNDQINSIYTREQNLIETISRAKQEIEDLEKNYQQKISSSEKERYKQINEEISKIKTRNQELETKRETYHVAKTEIARRESRLGELEKNYLKLKEDLYNLAKEITSIKESMKKLSEKGIGEGIKTKKKEHEQELERKRNDRTLIEKEIISLITKKDIQKQNIDEVLELNKCPTCKQIVTKEYKDNLKKELKEIIEIIEKDLHLKNKNKDNIEKEIQKTVDYVSELLEKERELNILNNFQRTLEEKENHFAKDKTNESLLNQEIAALKIDLENSIKTIVNIENIENMLLENQEKVEKLKEELMKLRNTKPEFIDAEKDKKVEIAMKKQEIERTELIIKNGKRDKIELESKHKESIGEIERKEKDLDRKQKKQEEIDQKFKSQLEEKSKLQEKIHENENVIRDQQTKQMTFESEMNELKIQKAGFDAEISTLDLEFRQFGEIEVLKMPVEELERRIRKHEGELQNIGSVNMRALEVYDKVKEEYDFIEQQVKKLEEEKMEILKLIEEIDKKKKRAFMQAFDAINESFSRNFMMLSNKGEAFMDLENKQDPFESGLNVIIRLAKGKYMDAESLSGGEKTIVALAMIFAIQKYKPYSFYIFDEIDAALDKRNSERLAELMKQNIKSSQYIIISHNDYIIQHAQVLYGTSMQEGVSKIVSLKF
ncbi:chromosome segregation protein SMC [Candidatus Pacearchaeota archaeon]|nr:chromosome segregation protein SMC [Candidatus Pacearchaeota archaeon]